MSRDRYSHGHIQSRDRSQGCVGTSWGPELDCLSQSRGFKSPVCHEECPGGHGEPWRDLEESQGTCEELGASLSYSEGLKASGSLWELLRQEAPVEEGAGACPPQGVLCIHHRLGHEIQVCGILTPVLSAPGHPQVRHATCLLRANSPLCLKEDPSSSTPMTNWATKHSG